MSGNALKGVTGAAIAAYALTYQGVRYLWGGNTPTTGFDCSGFARWVYAHRAGIDLPRMSQDQAGVGVDVLGGPYLPGDLLFFHGSSHEGISLGGSRFIHAPHTGDVVKISTLGAGYQPNAARRLLSDSQAAAGSVSSVATGTSDAESWSGWARRTLTAAGFPVTAENLKFFLGWMRAENPGPDYSWNPLATTLKTRSATRSGGVQAYKDELGGIQATVQTIAGGQYGQLRAALHSGSSSSAAWAALRSSPWDAGHYASQPTLPYQQSDASNLVVGAKKGGGGGVLDTAQDAVLGIGAQVVDPFGLLGVGKSPADAAGAVTDSVLGPVGGAISDAAGAVVGEVESIFVRGAYIVVGVLLAGLAGVLIVQSVGGKLGMPTPSSSPSPSSSSSGAAGAGGAAGGAGAAAGGEGLAGVAELAAA